MERNGLNGTERKGCSVPFKTYRNGTEQNVKFFFTPIYFSYECCCIRISEVLYLMDVGSRRLHKR